MTGPDAPSGQRLDKWLVYARFAKTRGVAAQFVSAGRIRVNGRKSDKPDQKVRTGDVLTLNLPHGVIVAEIAGFAERRGSPQEAGRLYLRRDAPTE